MSNQQLYDQDFYAWANEQAELLRAGRLSDADIEHIAQEIERLGRNEKRELVNRLTVLLVYLLKWWHQPVLRSRSWRLTVEEQRNQLEDHLADNPSLKSVLEPVVMAAYRNAILGASRETGLDSSLFAAGCPWSFGQIADRNFWPDAD